MVKILNIIESAYRATVEEQDDTVLWFSHMLKNSGAEVSLLLKSNAVNYAAKGQNAQGLVFGSKDLARAPKIDADLEAMIGKEIPVYLVAEDARERGLNPRNFIAGVHLIQRKDVPELMDRHGQVWHW